MSIRYMGVEEFARRFKRLIESNDAKFCFFLGAGCSVSSGIPTSANLVDNVWLPKLKELETGNQENFNEWLNEKFPNYNKEKAAQFYGEIIENLFPTPKERQQEIERLVANKDPGFGYTVLAQLLAEKCGEHCNIILTTNFDDMVADALYLYTNKKPIVIFHESLAGFVKISDTRPVVVKLHGDSKLSPLNTREETTELNDKVKKVIKNLFSEAGLIFIGYGGNDKSITDILNEVPKDGGSFQWGIYWIGQRIPNSEMEKFLEDRNAIWVNHKDFDELMLLIKIELGLKHPSNERFKNLFEVYFDKFKKLNAKINAKPDSGEKKTLEKAIEKASQEFKSWWAVELEAAKYMDADPDKTEQIYQNGINQFSDSYQLLGSYASFLANIRKDYEKAEEMYKKAIKIEPNNANNLGLYANFLKKVPKDYDKAEEMYRKALEIEPENASNLEYYAIFLSDARKDYDKAEEIYRKVLEIEPEYAYYLEIYANFLSDIRKDYDKAEEIYRKAVETDPEDTYYLDVYANFLSKVRKDYDKAEEIYRKILEIEPENSDNLENYAIFLKEIHKDYDKAEEMFRKTLEIEPDNTAYLVNYANFLTDILENHIKAEEIYRKILEIEPENSDNLESYAIFLKEIHKDYDKAEEMLRKALEIEPDNTAYLGNYANFLVDIHKDYDKAEEMLRKALEIEPENADNLENYAIFLRGIRKDYEKAEEMHKKALEIRPDDADCLGNYAGFLLARGSEENGFYLLRKAISLANKQNLLLECWFYCYAHTKEKNSRNQSLDKIKDLIKSGVRSPFWNLEENVNYAVKSGHPEPEFLETLSRVISDEADAKELDNFDVWLHSL